MLNEFKILKTIFAWSFPGKTANAQARDESGMREHGYCMVGGISLLEQNNHFTKHQISIQILDYKLISHGINLKRRKHFSRNHSTLEYDTSN